MIVVRYENNVQEKEYRAEFETVRGANLFITTLKEEGIAFEVDGI